MLIIEDMIMLQEPKKFISSYPTIGHVITNASNNAHSHLWTLRTNPNVDAVMGAANSIIHEEFVPSLANEQVIIDVINEFKNANKKVILYINAQSLDRKSSAAAGEAWNNYVDTYFSGDKHAAHMNLIEGYIKRFEALGVDGYWIDAFSGYGGGDDDNKTELIQAIRNIDLDVMITTNNDKAFFKDDSGSRIMVDTDGEDETYGLDSEIGGDHERDYNIIKLDATDPWSDITAGHITPLAQGAPPRSWAYEEFTVTDIEQSPTTTYDGSKLTVKHFFLPIRRSWSS